MDITAAHFNISTEEATDYYKELHNRHALFLDLEALTIRMARTRSLASPRTSKSTPMARLITPTALGHARHPRRAPHGCGHRSGLHGE
ncbi:MAG: hypothetical protein U0V48_18515 [Anaerolineales bacterium]